MTSPSAVAAAVPALPAAARTPWKAAWRRSVATVTALVCSTLVASGYIGFRLSSLYQDSSRDGAAAAPSAGGDARIPLVEGQAVNRNLVLRILGKLGYDADVAEDGAMPEERERCFSSGMQGFLSRPLAPAELRRVLREWAPLGGVPGSSGQRAAPVDPKAVAI